MFNSLKSKMDWGLIVLVLAVLGAVAIYMQNRQSDKDQKKYRTNAVSERDSISKDVKEGSEMIEVFTKNSEALKYFRENNFSITKTYFPYGCFIIRQFKNGTGFSKSTHNGKEQLYENFQYKLVFKNVFDERRAVIVSDGNAKNLISNGRIAFGQVDIGHVDIGDDNLHELQRLNGIRVIGKTGSKCDFFILLELDESGYTFAIGRKSCN